MPTPTQLILELGDSPNALTQLTDRLHHAGVEIGAVGVVPSTWQAGDDDAASLAEAASRWAEGGINTVCAYATVDGSRPVALILNAADAAKAAAALSRAGP